MLSGNMTSFFFFLEGETPLLKNRGGGKRNQDIQKFQTGYKTLNEKKPFKDSIFFYFFRRRKKGTPGNYLNFRNFPCFL